MDKLEIKYNYLFKNYGLEVFGPDDLEKLISKIKER